MNNFWKSLVSGLSFFNIWPSLSFEVAPTVFEAIGRDFERVGEDIKGVLPE